MRNVLIPRKYEKVRTLILNLGGKTFWVPGEVGEPMLQRQLMFDALPMAEGRLRGPLHPPVATTPPLHDRCGPRATGDARSIWKAANGCLLKRRSFLIILRYHIYSLLSLLNSFVRTVHSLNWSLLLIIF